MLADIAMAVGATSILTLSILAVAKFAVRGFEFWPPPKVNSWQHIAFRWLFRVFFLSLVALSVLDFKTLAVWQHFLGSSLAFSGFGLALKWTGALGWQDAFGDPSTLKTTGPYTWSRNPIYVVSIVGMVGWGLAIGSVNLAVLLSLWALIYVAAPFLEEPWLERQFGAEYSEYVNQVPRYFRLFR